MKKSTKQTIAFAVILTLLLSLGIFPVAANGTPSFGRYVISIPEDKKLIFRASPDADGKVIDYLYNGEAVDVVKVVGNFGMARQNGKDGYFSLEHGKLQKEYELAELIANISSADAEKVDFVTLSENGVKGVLLRAMVSVDKAGVIAADQNFVQFYQNAVKAKLKVGAYVTSSAATKEQIEKEVSRTLDFFEENQIALSLPVFYCPAASSQLSSPKEKNTELVQEFCEEIEEAKLKAGVFLPYDKTSACLDFDTLNEYAHWIADYGDYCNFTKTYDIWQYEEKGEMDGVEGKIGLNYMFFDVSGEPQKSEPTTAVPNESTTGEKEQLSTGHTHTIGDFIQTKAATCTKNGEETAFCTECGKPLATRLIAPLGHQNGDWKVIQEPTEKEDGLSVSECKICGKRVQEHLLDATGSTHVHTPGDWKTVGINDDGELSELQAKTDEKGTTSPNESNPSKQVCNSDVEKTLSCEKCGKVLYRVLSKPEEHQADKEPVVKEADCENDGHIQTVCKVCGIVMHDSITPAFEHHVEKWKVIRPAEDGKDGESQGVCVRCGKTITSTIPYKEQNGDADGNGKVNSIDARLVLRHAAKLDSLADEVTSRCDMNGDGLVNSADARIILRIAAKLE